MDEQRYGSRATTDTDSTSLNRSESPPPTSMTLFDQSPEGKKARSTYLKIFGVGTFSVILMILGILPIYWGALWKVPARNIHGWVVDFDGGLVGEGVSGALVTGAPGSRVTWSLQPPERFQMNPDQLAGAVGHEDVWVAIAIYPGVSARLNEALSAPDSQYDGSRSIVAFAVEARNENAFRNLIRPSVDGALSAATRQVALQVAARVAASNNAQSILAASPQTILNPVGYTIDNLVPFDQPVATASTFVGMLFQLIMGFFVVMISLAAREASGYDKSLPVGSLIGLRLVSSLVAYFFISLFYCLLNLAFQLDVTRMFGRSGFLVFWMVNFVGMLAVCLALESLITVLTPKGIPFFMLLWIISNLSASIFPIDVLPGIYRYGYASPFYNLSRALRTIIFGTRNRVGEAVGILFAWAALSVLTLILFQWLVRRKRSSPPTEKGEADRSLDGQSEDETKS